MFGVIFLSSRRGEGLLMEALLLEGIFLSRESLLIYCFNSQLCEI